MTQSTPFLFSLSGTQGFLNSPIILSQSEDLLGRVALANVYGNGAKVFRFLESPRNIIDHENFGRTLQKAYGRLHR